MEGSYGIRHFTTDNGLPQNSVKAVCFDRAGYCWLATEMGLVRYDGRAFRVFGTANLEGVASDRIQYMLRSAAGDVYAMTASIELLEIYHPADDYAPVPRRSQKDVLLGNRGLAIDNPASVEQIRRTVPHYPTARYPDYFGLPDGSVYLYNHDSLFCIRPDGEKERLPDYRKGNGKTAPDLLPFPDHVLHITGNQAFIWQGTAFLGTLPLPEEAQVKQSPGPAVHPRFYVDGMTTYFVRDRALYQLVPDAGRLDARLVLKDLPADDIACVAHFEGKYYIGTFTNGLYEMSLPEFAYPRMPAELRSENFYAQARINDSLIFVRDVLLPVGKSGAKMLPTHTATTCAYLTEGNAFYFEEDYQLKKYDLRTGDIRFITSLDNRLRYIGRQEDGRVIFATTKFIGRLENDTVADLRRFPDQLVIDQVVPLSKWRYLLCTESGLKWYDIRDNRVYFDVLDAVPIRTALPERSDRIWIASYGRGCYLLDRGRLYPFPLGPLEALKTVHAFIHDASGNLWLPTNNGLFRVRKNDLVDALISRSGSPYFFRLSREQGLRTNEFNGGCDPAFVWLKDSLLSLPSLNGLVWFYPHKIQVRLPLQRLYVDRIMLNNRPFDGAAPIVLPPDFTTISVAVGSPYFGNRENLSFEYRLAGLNDEWHPLPESGTLTLNGIPAGNYRILFRKAGNPDGEAPGSLVIPLTVRPWFYQTIWFWCLAASAVAITVWLFWKRRSRALKMRAAELEAQVAARTAELSVAVEDLARSELALSCSNEAKDKVMTMVLHDLRSPIRFITQISSYIADNFSELSREEAEKMLFDLKVGSKALDVFARDFFVWAVSQKEGFEPKPDSFAISLLFTEIRELYEEILASRNNRLAIRETMLACCTDYQILSFVLRNLIDNANKNTTDGTISLDVGRVESTLVFTVADTGPGLSQAEIDYFFDRRRKTSAGGTGSLLIMDMLSLIGASIHIDSPDGGGSSFRIIIPDSGGK